MNRKDNELLKVAKHSENKVHFRDYLTDIDVSTCETLPVDYQNHLDRKFVQKGGIDVDEFRAWCTNLDKDEAWIAKTEKELF